MERKIRGFVNTLLEEMNQNMNQESDGRKHPPIVNALDRGLSILEILATEGESLGVTDLSKRISVNKATVYRLLSTLASRGYVELDPEVKKYRASLGIVKLGGMILNRIELGIEAGPALKELAQRTDESAHLAVLSDGEAVYIDREVSKSLVAVKTELGMQVPLHCSAIGKAMIAFLPEDELQQIIDRRGLPGFTDKTITSLAKLKRELSSVRKQGYAVDDEEYTVGVRCVAAPVWSHRGEVEGSIGVSGPSNRVTLERIPEIGLIVKEIGEKIFGKP